MITLRTPDGDKSPANLTLQTASGQEAIARILLRTPDGDEVVYAQGGNAIAVQVIPGAATGAVSFGSTSEVSTGSVTASATGGTAPYTWSWAFTSGDSGWTISDAASASTRFINSVPPDESRSGVFTVTGTDARGRTGTLTVNAIVYNFGNFGGV